MKFIENSNSSGSDNKNKIKIKSGATNMIQNLTQKSIKMIEISDTPFLKKQNRVSKISLVDIIFQAKVFSQ